MGKTSLRIQTVWNFFLFSLKKIDGGGRQKRAEKGCRINDKDQHDQR